MKNYLHSMAIIGYGFSQWMLFVKITALAGFEAAGNYSLAQAVSGPVFGFFLLSMRSLWVANLIPGINYKSLYFIRNLMMIMALIISTILMQIFEEYNLIIIAVVFAIKYSEGVSDIVYAKFERAGEGYFAAYLLTIKSLGLILVLLLGGHMNISIEWICRVFIVTLICFLIYDLYHGGKSFSLELNFYVKIKWPNKRELTQMLFLSFNSLFISFVGFLPRYALDFYSTRNVVGYYTFLMLPLSIVMIAVTGYLQSNLQRTSEMIKHRSSSVIWISVFHNLFVFSLLFSSMFMLVYIIFYFDFDLLKGYFLDSKIEDIAKVLVLGVFACFAQYLSYIIIAMDRPKSILNITLISLVAQSLVIFITMNDYDINHAFLMQLIGAMIQIIGYFLIIKKFNN